MTVDHCNVHAQTGHVSQMPNHEDICKSTGTTDGSSGVVFHLA